MSELPVPPTAPPRRGWLGPLLASYWLLIYTATHLPQAALPQTSLGDKTEHFIAYALLAGIMLPWVMHRWPAARFPWLIVLLVSMAYGGIDEITQPIVNRYADLRDWLADSTGAAIGLGVSMTVIHLRHKSLHV